MHEPFQHTQLSAACTAQGKHDVTLSLGSTQTAGCLTLQTPLAFVKQSYHCLSHIKVNGLAL